VEPTETEKEEKVKMWMKVQAVSAVVLGLVKEGKVSETELKER
jgi:hypothetical protein